MLLVVIVVTILVTIGLHYATSVETFTSVPDSPKLRMLRNPKYFQMTGNSLQINMPIEIQRELRVHGTLGLGKTQIRLAENANDIKTQSQKVKSYFGSNARSLLIGAKESLVPFISSFKPRTSGYIPGYADEVGNKYKSENQAAYECSRIFPKCKGITYDPSSMSFTLRAGDSVIPSSSNEWSRQVA